MHKPNQFNTAKEVTNFISAFHSGTFPRENWHHAEHLILALWYLLHYPETKVLELIRQQIIFYNQNVGIANTENSGYHETLTIFWLKIIADYLKNIPPQTDFLIILENLLNSDLNNPDLPLKYYTGDRLFSVTARQTYLAPDLQDRDIFQIINL
ncbi:MAG: hypothetical protein ACRC2J_11725 [Microcoleaceae cyanobacterium]